jgi:hypothetical protein
LVDRPSAEPIEEEPVFCAIRLHGPGRSSTL